MTTPTTDAPASRSRFTGRILLALVAAIIVLVALLTPEPTGARSGDDRLSSSSTGPQGAALLYELSARLGWHPSRALDAPWSVPDDSSDAHVTYLVLAPPRAPTAAEVHRLLARVRAGAGLLYVLGTGPLNDSLGVRTGPSGVLEPASAAAGEGAGGEATSDRDADGCPTRADVRLGEVLRIAQSMWPDARMHMFTLVLTRGSPARGERVVFGRVSPPEGPGTDARARGGPTAIGVRYGRGRLVLVADPDLLRNDVLRVCTWGADVIAVRMLEFLREPESGRPVRDRVVFDEYHQGFGVQPGTLRAVGLFLGGAASGHVLLQLCGAGLVLLLALGPRVLLPRDEPADERRSPLEHIDALARAYSRAHATRTVAARLLHGTRRRVGRVLGGAAERDDDAFLEGAARRSPERAGDVALVRRALTDQLSERELSGAGAALARIESSLRTSGA